MECDKHIADICQMFTTCRRVQQRVGSTICFSHPSCIGGVQYLFTQMFSVHSVQVNTVNPTGASRPTAQETLVRAWSMCRQ